MKSISQTMGARAVQTVRGFWLALAAVALLALAGCMPQLIRNDAVEAARKGDYEKALTDLKTGLTKYPDNTELKAAYVLVEDDASRRLVEQAKALIAKTEYDKAKEVVQRLQSVNPSSQRVLELQKEIAAGQLALQQLQRADRLITEGQPGQAAQIVTDVAPVANTQTAINAKLQNLQSRLSSQVRLPEGNGGPQFSSSTGRFVNASAVSFDFRAAPIGAVLEAFRKDAGLDFVLDRDVKLDTRITMFVKNARVDEALDLVLSAAQLASRVLDGKTLLIYPNTPDKAREHEELVVKVFRLNHVDARSAANMLRAMIKSKEPFVDEKANSLMLRDSPEMVAIAEQLMAMYDVNEGELMLEIEVLEVKRSRLTELGLNFPSSATLGPAKGTAWSAIGSWMDAYRAGTLELGVGNILGNFKREVGDFSVLANPKLRVKSREKAKILIGDKVPVVTTSTTTSGTVSDSISYLDVGIKLDAEPTISADNDILLKIGLEVSTLAKEVRTSSGALAYQIGTRNANTVLRLRDGETQLLGGLISNEDRSSSNRLPGLGDLPLLGRLFSSQKDDVQNTELVLAVTPRLIRAVADSPRGVTQIQIGTEAQPRLREFRNLRDVMRSGQAPTEAVKSVGANTGASTGAQPKMMTAVEPAAQATTGEPVSPPEPIVRDLVMTWRAPPTTQVAQVTEVWLDANLTKATRGLPLEIGYMPKNLEIVDVLEAGLFRQQDGNVGFSQSVNQQAGRIDVGMLRTAGGGATGSGPLLRIRFKAKESGAVSFKVNNVVPIGESGIVSVGAFPAVTVQVP